MISFRRFTAAGGVPAGANMPDQKFSVASEKPASPMVGTSGSSGVRFGDSITTARTVPFLMCCSTEGRVSITIVMLPASTSG